MITYCSNVQTPWSQPWDVCISFDEVYIRKDWKRIVFSALEHGDDWHLYYNMISFLWKGRSLEKRFGPLKFLIILVTFILATGITYLAINYALYESFQDRKYLRTCAVGFSGVIFALKVLCTHYLRNEGSVNFLMGIPIPSRYAFWAELLYISLISPNASFVGHLAGILVGLAYTQGPLEILVDTIEKILTGGASSPNRNQRFRSSGTTGFGYNSNQYEESYGAQPSAPPNDYWHPNSEDLRRRRAERYSWRKGESKNKKNKICVKLP